LHREVILAAVQKKQIKGSKLKVTGFAFEFFQFVFNIINRSFLLLFVAFFTGNVYVLSIKPECSFIMIEFRSFPASGIVAIIAICNAVLYKLIIMVVSMTCAAVRG
jgi:hypothetical protein